MTDLREVIHKDDRVDVAMMWNVHLVDLPTEYSFVCLEAAGILGPVLWKDCQWYDNPWFIYRYTPYVITYFKGSCRVPLVVVTFHRHYCDYDGIVYGTALAKSKSSISAGALRPITKIPPQLGYYDKRPSS